MAITLDATTKVLELTTSSTANIDYALSYVDMTTSAFTPADSQGTINTVSTTVIVAAPAASTQRGIKSISVFNRHATTANTVTVKKDVSGTEYCLFKAVLSAGESLQWTDGGEWCVFDPSGDKKVNNPSNVGVTGRVIGVNKVGTATEGTACWYAFWKDAGFNGAWSPGTPGINGRATDGMTAADNGCLPLWTPTGQLYITEAAAATTTLCTIMLADIVWVNTGLVVTTTTAQAITTPTFPARDLDGSTNGAGYIIGLVTTTANTNAAAITNSTVTYTNSDGVAGKTATLAAIAGDQIPATPVLGNVVWFQLAAGCKGVQSIQSITLGTSLVAGTVSLIVARPLMVVSASQVNVALVSQYSDPGIRLYTGSNLHYFLKNTSSSAVTLTGHIVVTER
jgi:hypothetical protein